MEELRRMRESLGMTQAELAAASGVDRATINQVETGRRNPRMDSLRKLAVALGVEVGDFFPKVQPPLFDTWRGTDEAVYPLVEAFNEALHRAQQAYAPGRELDWSREALEEVSGLIAKAAVAVAPVALGAGFDSHVEAVQVLARADEVVRLLDARAAEAPAQTGPLPDNVVALRGDVEDLRAAALERAG